MTIAIVASAVASALDAPNDDRTTTVVFFDVDNRVIGCDLLWIGRLLEIGYQVLTVLDDQSKRWNRLTLEAFCDVVRDFFRRSGLVVFWHDLIKRLERMSNKSV
ncbi:hypothetical protein C500_20880 [Natrialba magadii ATCC 43099]|uniref:Uncharacterized protein n=1 Tax=Natrialba magadii (strain ATCC 43099 / DSM 3394 / CCM 3739 / CIP 104546 / IAM 13178 / JCM 8861 / NBRC 102185 / NCIMB 2190 / MS3) TaxID=547559 RepID=L9UFH6_NATMM|nr:hypothetical protein C500_20880 [Natrialba magadii ATCC 43099]